MRAIKKLKEDEEPMNYREFEGIVRKYQGMVFSVAYCIILDEHESLDVAQNVFLKAFLQNDFLNSDFDQKNWLIRVARNESLNLKKSWWRKVKLLADYSFNEPVNDSPELAEFFAHHQSVARLREVLKAADEHDREIIALRYSAGYKYEQIAQELDIKIGTVMSRLARTRARIAEQMGDEYFD